MITGSYNNGAITAVTGANWRCNYVDTVPVPFTTTTGGSGYTVEIVNSYSLFIGTPEPIAQLTFDNGSGNKVAIQLNKKLNLLQRLLYLILGFKYKKL